MIDPCFSGPVGQHPELASWIIAVKQKAQHAYLQQFDCNATSA